ncbi:MAG: NADP-dependent oxidoreductase [Microbacteriaceae bacterium]
MTNPIVSRAARYEEFGPAEVLRVVDHEVPAPPPGKIRVAVRTAGLNPVDAKIRGGHVPAWAPTLPAGIGREMAGVVEAIGDGVTLVAVGDEVFGNVVGSAIAEHVITNPANMAHRPAELDWVTAGGLALAGQTAWDSVASQNITEADTVLISAAAGGVGALAAQLAVRAGATVIGTASESNHEHLRALGIIPVAYGEGMVERIRAACGRAVTVVLDHHGTETIEAAIALGVPLDRINTIATDAAAYGVRSVGRGPINTQTLDQLAALVVSGDLVVSIDSTYVLDDVVAAFTRLESGHARGKVVIEVAGS